MAPRIQNTHISVIVTGFFLLLSLLSPVSARAEGEGALSVSPLFTDVALQASEQSQEFFLTVANTTAEPVVLRLSLVDFGSLNESGGIAFLGKDASGTNRYALASWITPEKDVVTLLPDTEEKLKFTIENRESLSPGGHYGAVLFAIEPEGGDAVIQDPVVSVNSTFSSLVFAKKEGGILREFTLKEWSVESASLLSGLPSKTALRFQNSGNVDLTPRGRIILTDPLDRLVAQGIINEDSSRMFPESFRIYHSKLSSLIPGLIPGFYTLSAEYRFDGQEASQSAPEMRIFAWGVALWWGAGIGAILIGIRALRRKTKQAETL
ncbi:MAG: hypothetical protein KA731_01935 [Candidatus Moranbacteria bacterium]|nr:hypothetical protein [Candidatus Moranbacteria bacterium]MBP7696035.1 hypothetical protein [Candidatus Moranbacteria bacterium]